jgi:hypothetical protein
MKLAKSLLLLILSQASLSSILADNGNTNVPPSDIESSYRQLYKELMEFDYSQTIVRYKDIHGHMRKLLPEKDPLPPAKVVKDGPPYKPLSPGAILNLSIDFINNIQHHIVEILYEKFKSFDMPVDVEIPGFKVSNIHVDLDDLKVENLNLYLSEKDNSIVLGFSDLHMQSSADLKISKFMVSESGSMNVKLYLKHLVVKAHMKDNGTNDMMTPIVSVELIEMLIPKENMEIKLSLSYIPTFISSFIINFVRGTLIDKITSFLTDFMPGDGSEMANQLISEEYPKEISLLHDDLTMGMLLTEPIKVQADRLFVKVDAMAYSKSKGKGERDYPSHMAFKEDDGNNIVLGISQEMIESLMKSYVSDIMGNSFSYEYRHFKANLKTNISSNSFSIWESGMTLNKVQLDGELNYMGFTIDVNCFMNMKFDIKKIDFNAQKIWININKIELDDYSFKSNIPLVSSFGIYLKLFIESFGLAVRNYAIHIPALPFIPFDITLDQVNFRFENNFMVIKVDTKIKE